ncbi:MAG TPA: hypothetical protein VN893_04890 [Bryobacteraceae bacterium]|nr:hypothetical protein [Bryobacteraceae bacterium]
MKPLTELNTAMFTPIPSAMVRSSNSVRIESRLRVYVIRRLPNARALYYSD